MSQSELGLPSPIAMALAEREVLSNERFNTRVREIVGKDPEPTPYQELNDEISRVALNLQRVIENRHNLKVAHAINLAFQLREASSDFEHGDMVLPQYHLTGDQEAQIARLRAEVIIDDAQDIGLEAYTSNTIQLVELVEEMSAVSGKDAAELIKDDDSYHEITRRLFSPIDFADHNFAIADKITGQSTFESLLISMQGSELLLGGQSLDEMADVGERVDKLYSSLEPHQQSIFEDSARITRYAYYVVAAEDLKEIWGENAISQLPEDYRRSFEEMGIS